ASRTNPAYYRLINASTGTIQLPQFVQYNVDLARQEYKAILTFASDIPGGTFKLEVGNSTESDDTLTLAQHYANTMSSAVQAFIGDNVTLPAASQGNDVDIYRFDLSVGSALTINVVPAASGPTLDAAVRVFDAQGNPVGGVIDASGAGATESATIPGLSGGTFYYVAVSSHGNTTYNPASPPSAAVLP